MADLSNYNPTSRFNGLASLYAKCRPSYPAAALEYIMSRCNLKQNSILVDVGAGTGISARLFAERGLRVIGIEPNSAMRAQAEATPVSMGIVPPTYLDGRGEATGLAACSVDAILAAQSFHWFEPDAALAEFNRILRPRGWSILMWNERDNRDPFTAYYSAVIRTTPDAPAIEVPRVRAGQYFLESPLFGNCEVWHFANSQTLNEEELIGRAFSASYAPREPVAAEQFAQDLRDVFARFQHKCKVVIRYETSVYIGQKTQDA